MDSDAEIALSSRAAPYTREGMRREVSGVIRLLRLQDTITLRCRGEHSERRGRISIREQGTAGLHPIRMPFVRPGGRESPVRMSRLRLLHRRRDTPVMVSPVPRGGSECDKDPQQNDVGMNMTVDDIVVVLSTAPPEDSPKIARSLVEEGLAACVNIAAVRSFFRWQGEFSYEHEDLLVIKTRRENMDALTSRIRELHPYDLPEIVALPVVGGFEKYLEWVAGAGEV